MTEPGVSRKTSATDEMNAAVSVSCLPYGSSDASGLPLKYNYAILSFSGYVEIVTVCIYISAIIFTYTPDIYCTTFWLLVVYSFNDLCSFGSTDGRNNVGKRIPRGASPTI